LRTAYTNATAEAGTTGWTVSAVKAEAATTCTTISAGIR
jgi:hypothetical protein